MYHTTTCMVLLAAVACSGSILPWLGPGPEVWEGWGDCQDGVCVVSCTIMLPRYMTYHGICRQQASDGSMVNATCSSHQECSYKCFDKCSAIYNQAMKNISAT